MEERVAYDYAYSKWITTIDNIDNANLYWNISRIELAKMISYYAINVLKKTPDTTKICEFWDISKELDEQYFNWVTKVCQLWLMWVWIDDFYPDWKVSRAEFGTVLSRLLFNTPDWKDNYYTTHLAKLKSEWIISNDNPYFTETRWFVMIMLMRSDKKSNYDELEKNEKYFRVPMAIITNQNSWEIIYQNTPNLVYRNEIFWFQTELWPEWQWWRVKQKIYNEQFGENAISWQILFYKEWFEYNVYSLTIDKIEKYDSTKKHEEFWTEDEFEKWTKWKNNKYFFVGYANNRLAAYIDTTNEYLQLFPRWFDFFDVE